MKTIVDFFTSETFGFLLKLFSGLAAAAFGILGIGTKTREADGRLTRSGWIALTGIVLAGALAIGTSIYEFITALDKAKAAQAQSEQLILSVRRGIYPLRGMTASFNVDFDQDIAGLADYKANLRKAIQKMPSCDSHSKAFRCEEYIKGKPISYWIPSTSPLFPKAGSTVRTVLESVGVNISMYKRQAPRNEKDTPGYKFVGVFGIRPWIYSPERWSVAYNYPKDSLGVEIDSMEVPDGDLSFSRVYSLVDFIPGLVTAYPEYADDPLCDALEARGFRDCVNRVIRPLRRNLAVNDIRLQFKYPKSLDFPSNFSLTCPTGHYRALFLSRDVDSTNNLGDLVSEEHVTDDEKRKACEGIANPNGPKS